MTESFKGWNGTEGWVDEALNLARSTRADTEDDDPEQHMGADAADGNEADDERA